MQGRRRPGLRPAGPTSTTTSSSHTANAPGFQGVEVALALATLALVATVAVVLGLERRVRPAALPVESNVGTHAPSVLEVCSIGFNSHRPPPILMDDGENRRRFVPRSPGGGCPGRGLSGRELGAAVASTSTSTATTTASNIATTNPSTSRGAGISSNTAVATLTVTETLTTQGSQATTTYAIPTSSCTFLGGGIRDHHHDYSRGGVHDHSYSDDDLDELYPNRHHDQLHI